MHKKLCSSPLPNALSLKIPVPSNLTIAVWRNTLHSYHDLALVDFLEFGWPINYVADSRPQPVNRNHPSAIKHAFAVRKFINNKVNLQATAGPFRSNPLDCQLIISPLLTVPKKDSINRRVVMDPSYPPNCSVNDRIPTDSFLGEPFTLRLPGVDSLVQIIQKFGPGCLLFKTDLSCAYRQLPIDPRDYHHLGYRFDKLIFFDTVFAFGLRPATLGCQRTANAVTYLYTHQGYFCTNYVDDFGGCDCPSRASDAFHALKKLLFILGLKTSTDKDCPPSTLIVFLGTLFDTIQMTMSIPQAKLEKRLQIIKSVINASNHFSSSLAVITFINVFRYSLC